MAEESAYSGIVFELVGRPYKDRWAFWECRGCAADLRRAGLLAMEDPIPRVLGRRLLIAEASERREITSKANGKLRIRLAPALAAKRDLAFQRFLRRTLQA